MLQGEKMDWIEARERELALRELKSRGYQWPIRITFTFDENGNITGNDAPDGLSQEVIDSGGDFAVRVWNRHLTKRGERVSELPIPFAVRLDGTVESP